MICVAIDLMPVVKLVAVLAVLNSGWYGIDMAIEALQLRRLRA